MSTQEDKLTGIANAIRSKDGTTAKIVANNFETRIKALQVDSRVITSSLTTITTSAFMGRAVVYGGGLYVAIGGYKWSYPSESTSTSAYRLSINGSSWREVSFPINAKWSDIAYSPAYGTFVVISYYDNRFLYSNSFVRGPYSASSSITWQYVTVGTQYYSWISVAYGAPGFIAIATNSKVVARSTNGKNWTLTSGSQGLPTDAPWSCITYGKNMYVAIAGGYSVLSNTAAYSYNGVDWTSVTLPRSAYWSKVAYGNGRFVAVSRGIATLYSTDGISWIVNDNSGLINADWFALTYGSGRFLAIASGVAYATSTDGLSWKVSYDMPTSTIWSDVAYGDNDTFVAVAALNRGTIATEDGYIASLTLS